MKTKWNLFVALALVLALLTPAQTVYAEQAPVTYTFTASPEPSGYEADVIFTLEAAGEYIDTNGTHYPPFGYVTFYDNGGAISDCSNVALNGGRNPQDGVYIPATCTVSMNTPGVHAITAFVAYEVDIWFASGTVTLQGGHTVSDPLLLTFTPDTLEDFMYGANYGASIPALISVSGGDGSYYFQYPVLNLPAGLQVETYNTNSAWVHGRPAELGTGYSFTMTVGDYNGYRSSKTYTFDVITNTPTINVFDRVYNAGDYDMDLLATMDYPIVTGLQPPSGTLAFSLDGVPVENCSAIQTADTSRYCLLSDTSGLTVGDHTITVVYTPDEAASPYYNSSTGTGTLTVNSAPGYIYGAFFVDADQDGAKDAGEDNYIDHTWVVALNQACDSDISNDRTATIASDDYYFRFPDTPTGYRYCITVALPAGYTQTNTPDFTLSGESFFDVGVYWPQLFFSPAALPNGTVNEAYSQAITISSGTGPYTISEVQAYLPEGVTFNQETLTVSGIATTASYAMVAFHALDSAGLAGDFSSTFMFLLNGRFNLTSSANPSASGDPVTFTFTGEGDYVDDTGQNIPPSGSVDFYDGDVDVPIPGCAGVPLNYNAVSPAECIADGLADGAHSIKAVFTAVYTPYHGAELTLDQQVGAVPTTYSITGTLFNDLDGDGLKDTGEEPKDYWPVYLDQGCDGSSEFEGEADESGQFSFADLTAGLCYRLDTNPYNEPDWTPTTTVGDITLDADESFEIGMHYSGLLFSPERFSPGEKDVTYNQTMTVSGGTPPYTFTVDEQWTAMPPGVTYAIDGDTITVSGTPTQAGVFGISFHVQDSEGLDIGIGSAIIIRGADATFTFTSVLNPSVLGQEATFELGATGVDSGIDYLTPRGLVTFSADGNPIGGCVDLLLYEHYDDSSGEWVDHNPVECKTAALTAGEHAITADFNADTEGIYNNATGLTLEGGHTVVETGYTISGTAFNDLDLDGVMDEGEAGVAGATVHIDAGCDGSANLNILTADGSYSAVLPGGYCYSISAFAPSMKQTAAVTDIASLAADTSGVNIGLVELALAVDPASLPDGIVGEPYNQTITVSGGTAPYIFNLDLNLPEGLEYAVDQNAGTLTISGTPTAYGEAYVGGTVQDASGLSLDFGSYFYIKVKVNLTFNSAPNPSVLGETVIFSLGISDPGGGEVAGTVEFYDGEGDLAGCEETFPLNYGMTEVVCSTALLAEGSHQVRATYDPLAEGSIYGHAEATLEHFVAAPVTVTVLPETIPQGQVGAAYSQQFTASGGTGPYAFATASTLPNGLSFSDDTLSGTPTESGEFPITVTATDAADVTGSRDYILTINTAPPLTLMPETLPGGLVFAAYSTQLTAANGTEPYTFSLIGTLPTWLALSDQGLLSGTPEEAGMWNFTIQVTDSSSPAKTASRDYTIEITALTISGTTFTDTSRNGILDSGEEVLPFMEVYLDQGCDGTVDGFENSGAEGIYTSDPLALNQKYCVNAYQMFGLTRTSQPVTIDSLAESITGLNFGFVENSLVATSMSLPNGELNVQYDQAVTVSGGTGPYTFYPMDVDLPAGLSYTFDGSTGVFTISGKPGDLGEAWIVGVVEDANMDEAAINIHFAIRADLTVTFTSSLNPSLEGQAVTFSFGVEAPPGSQYPDPLGDVTFLDGEKPLDECIDLLLDGSEGGTNPVTCTTSALGPGMHTITAQYYDDTGIYNDVFPTLEQVVNADTTPPVITSDIQGTTGQNGWYISDVTLTWSVNDAESAISSQSGCDPVTITSDQAATDYTCTATSDGGTNSVTVTIGRDATAPTVTVTAGRDPDVNGWYNHAIGFTASGTDATSGNASCDPISTYSGPDSATASVNGTCTDNAGNEGYSETFNFQYDGTAPVVTVTADRDPNANGWYNASIGFTASGTDATSGSVTCEAITSYTGPDGDSLSVTGTCMDAAGNSATSEPSAFKYDATPPTATITPQRDPDSNGWYNHEIGFTTSGTDATSGPVTCTDIQYASADGVSLSVTGNCTDQAGNTGTSEEFAFKYDGTPPTVTITADRGPDASDWYNHAIGFTASGTDAASGNASCDPIVTYSGPDSATASVNGTCTDLAGNEGNETFNFKYDATKPAVTVTGVTEGTVYVQGNVPEAGCNTTDATSSVLTDASVSVTGGTPDNTGSYTATCSGALDNAGNAGDPVIVNYTVVSPSYYTFKIDVTTNGADGLTILVGTPVTWQYVVTNVSSGNLTNIIVTDSDLGQVCKINRLAPQASRTCTKTGVAVAGLYSNTGTATVLSNGTTYTASDDSSYFGAAPTIDVEKLVSVDLGLTWQDADSPTGPNAIVGDPVQFKFVITNTGNIDLSNITLSDTDLDLSPLDCSTPTTLAAGSSYECVVEIPATIGQHTNTATATGDYGGITYTDSDNANYHGGNTIEPDIAINSLTITINKARTTVSGQFVITDETEDGTTPDGFLVDLTDYGLDWAAKAAKTNVYAPIVPSSGCTYNIVAVDYEQVAGWHSGDPITFDETVTIGYTCTFGATQLPAGGTLRGTAWSYIFDQMDMKYTYIATKAIPR